MKHTFTVTFDTSHDELWDEARMSLKGTKEVHEMRDAFYFLTAWKAYLQSLYGELYSITHLSNPDDPPDVIAHFTKVDLNIEITSLEPNHIHQSEPLVDLHSNKFRTSIPISYIPRNRSEAEEIILTPGHPNAWENVADRAAVRYETVVCRIKAKLENPRLLKLMPGVILLTGSLMGDPFEEQALKEAFQEIRKTPQSEGWTLATIYQWNHCSYYFTLDGAESGFQSIRNP